MLINVGLWRPACNAGGRGMTAMSSRSALLEGFEALHFPLATLRSASFTLQPRLRLPEHVARQKIAAGETALVVCCERRDVAARARIRILPRNAAVFRSARKRLGGDCACVNQIGFRRNRSGRRFRRALSGSGN